MSEEWRAQSKSKAAAKDGDGYSARDWLLQIKLAEHRNEKWEKRCKKIVKRYRNQHIDDSSDKGSGTSGMNVLWSNVETLQPSIYGREPVPIAERRFLDKDVTGRVASQILERSMRYEMGDCGFHDSVEQCVKDYLLVGRGVAWMRFKPIIGQDTSLADRGDDDLNGAMGDPDETKPDPGVNAEDRDGEEQTEQTPQEKLLAAGIEVDYVHWTDFFTSKARFWKENEWVARRLYPSRDDLISDFGEEIGEAVPLEMSPEQDEIKAAGAAIDNAPDSMRKAIVFEIWHKPTRKVYTVAKGFDKFLEEPREDPLNLEGFWPCPKPLFATMTNDTLEPVPDYLEYQDQALQIDELTNRISLLTKALKVAGVYDAANKQLARLLDEGNENKLIAVPNWSSLSEKGGLAQAISFVPIKEIADVLMGLVQARDKVKEDMFEITGLSDVIRGQADPRETAEAVATKGRWGSLRLQARQQAVARFCRDIIRMMGEIIAEHYPPELMVNVSGAMFDDGIGGPAPEEPPKPDAPPNVLPGSPGMGHNGGPPIGQPPVSGMAGQPQMGVPPALAGTPPMGVHPVAPPGLGQANVAPAGPVAPPPPSPQIQYAMAMMQWQQKMMQHQAEKQALIMKAIGLLKQDKMRGFRIDIETDSTVQNDANEEKSARIEFIKATTGFVEQAFQIGKEAPDAAPMLGKMLLFGVRGFRAGRDLESTIEEFVDKMEQDAAKSKNMPPPPNPELQKAQLELQSVQAKSQAEVQKAQTDAQASAQDNQRAIEQKQIDAQIAQQQAAADMQKLHQEMAFKQQEFEMKIAELKLQMEATAREHSNKLILADREHAHKTEQMTAQHKQKMAESGGKPSKEKSPKFDEPPMHGARQAPDGKWYIQHPKTGQYYRVDKKAA